MSSRQSLEQSAFKRGAAVLGIWAGGCTWSGCCPGRPDTGAGDIRSVHLPRQVQAGLTP